MEEQEKAKQARHARAGGGAQPADPPPVDITDHSTGGQNKPKASGSSFKSWAIGLGVAAVVVVGAFGLLGGGASDHVTDAEGTARVAEFSAHGTFVMPQVPEAEQQQSIAAMVMDEDQKQELSAQVEAGQKRLVYMTLWDTHDEDNDRVLVTSENYAQVITILHAKQTIAIPEPSSGIVNVKGVNDGGGGITIGVMSGSVPVNLPFLAPEGPPVGIPVIAGL